MIRFPMYYEGVDGIVRFDKFPIFYNENDLFDYSFGFDTFDLPSGQATQIRRLTTYAQTYEITLQIVGNNKGEVLDDLHDRFQRDVERYLQTGKLARLWVGDSYLECLLSAKSHAKWNAMVRYENITIQVLSVRPKWTTEEEFSYQRADLQTNPYDLNLIKPPYDFSELEFTQPAKPLEEANLIPNGWDDFEPYGSGKNFVENWNFEDDDMSMWNNREKNENNTVTIIRNWSLFQDIELEASTKYICRIKVESEESTTMFLDLYLDSGEIERVFAKNNFDGVGVAEFNFESNQKINRIAFVAHRTDQPVDIHWIQITPIDNQHLVVEKTPLENGLTRIQAWGGNHPNKLIKDIMVQDNSVVTTSIYLKNLSDEALILNHNRTDIGYQVVPAQEEGYFVFTGKQNHAVSGFQYNIRRGNHQAGGHLDFIASDPIIYEDDGSMIYDIEEYDDKYRVRTMNSHSKTKMKFPIKKSVFKNEQYTHSLYVENKGNKDVLFKSEEGLYLENPVIEIKPDEKGTYAYTGTVSQDGLYTNFELATKEVEDELDLILAKPAVRYGDKPFDWPPEEEIVPLRLPTHMPFWITADDSIKYISNNSIGDTLAKITVFGPIKNPTLYIGSNTYRVYEELLENERIEIDQRAKTVIKVTASGDRVNVFHLRDKEHSVFKPIPEGENTVTQNDDFSYTIILYHERNEPKWS